ncbi:hypothetical protein BJX61DRAFT_540672 [Aspergillus egyptiacus]|nr:hypothetical protein BJX61DRAFT_540672 [Aspergillus egyptiacus]
MVVIPVVNTAQRATIGISVAFIVLPCVAVGFRLSARRIKRDWLDLSDYLIVAGLLFAVAYSALSISLVVNCGVGVRSVNVVLEYGMEPIQLLVREILVIPILCVLANTCVKLSLLAFYCRIFSFPHFIFAARVLAAVILALTVASVLCSALLCHPNLGNVSGIHAQCSDQVLAYVITGSLILATDFAVLLMPLPYLRRVNLKQPQKSLVFGITCIATILRIVYNSQLNYSNLSMTVTDSLIWGGVEPSLGVTLACAPFLRPLLSSRSSRSASTTQHPYYTQSSHGKHSQKQRFKTRIGRSFHPYDPYPLQTLVSSGAGMEGTTVRDPSPSPSPPGSATDASERHILEPEPEREPEPEPESARSNPTIKIMVRKELEVRDGHSDPCQPSWVVN